MDVLGIVEEHARRLEGEILGAPAARGGEEIEYGAAPVGGAVRVKRIPFGLHRNLQSQCAGISSLRRGYFRNIEGGPRGGA